MTNPPLPHGLWMNPLEIRKLETYAKNHFLTSEMTQVSYYFIKDQMKEEESHSKARLILNFIDL